MAPEIAARLNATTQTAKDKGRQHNALKPGSKKKRSKAELDEVRNIEAQLKAVSTSDGLIVMAIGQAGLPAGDDAPAVAREHVAAARRPGRARSPGTAAADQLAAAAVRAAAVRAGADAAADGQREGESQDEDGEGV